MGPYWWEARKKIDQEAACGQTHEASTFRGARPEKKKEEEKKHGNPDLLHCNPLPNPTGKPLAPLPSLEAPGGVADQGIGHLAAGGEIFAWYLRSPFWVVSLMVTPCKGPVPCPFLNPGILGSFWKTSGKTQWGERIRCLERRMGGKEGVINLWRNGMNLGFCSPNRLF